MPSSFSFPHSVAFITDNKTNAASIVRELSSLVSVNLLMWNFLELSSLDGFDILVIDVDLAKLENIERLKTLRKNLDIKSQTIFSADRGNRAVVAQTNALGANHVIARPINSAQLVSTIFDICNLETNQPKSAHKLAGDACLNIADTMDMLTLSARKGGKLPLEEMSKSCESVIQAVASANMQTWLQSVRAHSSFTYRHVMIVTGFAALFGVKFGMKRRDIDRLTLGALLHDVGKVKIPIKILDKPGKLNNREMKIIRQHPLKGFGMVEKDGRLSDEVASIVRHHHELLDGSGYPDKLKGAEIPDIVRVMTVVDIFSALVDTRSYKTSLPMNVAYDMLCEMGPKLDQDIVRGFEPIAFDDDRHVMLQKMKIQLAA